MPRKRVVSRLIYTTKINCLMIDLKTSKPFKENYELNGKYTRDMINKKGNKLFDDGGRKFVKCLKATILRDRYTMPEYEFIMKAQRTKMN